MDKYRIILADDHAIFRHGIRRIIDETGDLSVVGEASNGFELLDLLKKITANMVILDISMPGMRGIEAAGQIKTRYPNVKILFLTMHNNVRYVKHILSSGTHGYMLKDEPYDELFVAIQKIREGKIYVSSMLANELIEEMSSLSPSSNETAELLSDRERQVLKLVSEGNTNKEIADLLAISMRTVENHRAKILKKLKLNNTTDLVKYSIQQGICELEA